MSVIGVNLETVFTGEVANVATRGSRLRARFVPGGLIFDRTVPRPRLQRLCNHDVYSTPCGLDVDDWEWTATVTTPGTPGWPFTFGLGSLTRANGGATPTWFAQWFAGGWIRFGTGATQQRLPILQSTTVSGGSLTVTLPRDPRTFPTVGQTVSLWPGCDGRWQTCGAYQATGNPEGKFGNRLNFGAHPYLPAGNPSLVKVSNKVAGGKKG